MKKMLNLILVLLLSILYSCAGNHNYYLIKKNTFNETVKPKDEIARVVFLRPATGRSGSGNIKIYRQDQLIGILPGSSYFTYEVKPGYHNFGSLFAKSADFLNAELEGGKTYYVFCARLDAVVKKLPLIKAVKKNSDLMQNVTKWLPELKQAELTEEGIGEFKIRTDSKGKFVLIKSGLNEFRIDIQVLRKRWLERLKTSLKEILQKEDGL